MLNFINNSKNKRIIFEFFIGILIVFYYIKLNFQYFIPISGDELNSILVYSTNIKTLLLKNFPGNVTFFHLVGYLKTIFFGYDLISYRSITFIFVLIHFWVLRKIKFEDFKIIIFFYLILLTNFSLYAGIYVGYIFSSSIFVYLFYLISKYDYKKNRIIFFLLFIQFYNHLVNIYLIIPILITLFFISDKKKFLKEFLIWFLTPSFIFYSISIVLTGLAALKISDTSINGVFFFIFENFKILIIEGFNNIFFYEGIVLVDNFSIKKMISDLYEYDKIITSIFILSIILSIVNLIKKKNKIFSVIIIFHFILFVLLNKLPPARIFTGFFSFYMFFLFYNFKNFEFENKIIKNSLKIFSLIFLSFLIYNFDFSRVMKNSIYERDITYQENDYSLNNLKKNCILVNNEFSEIQKKNYYYNYLVECDKKFHLGEFLKYYRS